ncbi:MAG: DUF4368 domain-containing protein [Clostridiales bacterium]|nr:DUF4368 domain-containing protein [Clostridiales bacterium]
MLNDSVDKIVAHAPDKISGHRKQKIEIYYKAADIINIADEDSVALDSRWKARTLAQGNNLTTQSGGTAFRPHRHLTYLLRYHASTKTFRFFLSIKSFNLPTSRPAKRRNRVLPS